MRPLSIHLLSTHLLSTHLFSRPLLLAALLAAGAEAAEQDFSAVQITSVPVAGSVHLLPGTGAGNIAVSLGADGVLMVDDQFAPLADKIKAEIARLGGQSPRLLLNTHFHADHSGGNERFADAATIIAHENVRVRLLDPEAPRAPAALPLLTYADGLSLHFNGEEIRLIHLPHGHTDGDSAVWFTASNVLHMGDEYVVGGFPFVDLSSGGSVEGLIENHERLAAQLPDDIRIIPGHGPLSTKAEMQAWIGMVKTTAGLVMAQVVKGRGLEQIKAEGLPPEYAPYGTGFINEAAWIEAIYRSSVNP